MQHNSTPFLHTRTGTFRSLCILRTYGPHHTAQLIWRQTLNVINRRDKFNERDGRCSSGEANKSSGSTNFPTFLRNSRFINKKNSGLVDTAFAKFPSAYVLMFSQQ